MGQEAWNKGKIWQGKTAISSETSLRIVKVFEHVICEVVIGMFRHPLRLRVQSHAHGGTLFI